MDKLKKVKINFSCLPNSIFRLFADAQKVLILVNNGQAEGSFSQLLSALHELNGNGNLWTGKPLVAL